MTVLQPPVSEQDATTAQDARLWVSNDGIWNTIQGEGPRLGRITTFLRLAGCNLACSWCDTSYTWDWQGRNGHLYHPTKEAKRTPVQAVFTDLVRALDTTHSLTITGGEPLLQWRNLEKLFNLFWNSGEYLSEINFETNGTIYPQWALWSLPIINYVVSPKLKNSGNPYLPDQLSTLKCFERQGADFKFVCNSISDLDEVSTLVSSVHITSHRIWIMPEGVSPGLVNARAQELVDAVIQRGWNLTTRFHLQLWGNTRAR